MAVRGEEVATSIEAHVRAAIERMVTEIRSSVEDVREVVDQQLKAALQSVQADVNSISFAPHIQKSIAELEESIQATMPAPAAGGGAERVKQAIQAVERGKSQVDILNALLEQCIQFGSRAALLILRGETFSGWKGLGFSASGGNDESIKRFNAAPGLIPELDHVLRNERGIEWDGANLSTRFGVPASTRAVLVPMVIKDKVAAAVYIDANEGDVSKFDRTSIELVVFATGLLIDTLSIRKKSPSPTLGEGEAAALAPAAAAPRPPQAAAAPPAARPPAPEPPPAAPATPSAGEATVAATQKQLQEMMAAPAPRPQAAMPTFGGTVAVPRTPAAPPAAAPPAAPKAPVALPSDDRPSTQYIPPAGVVARSTAQAAQPPDAKKHDEARRFARLLVSEIKLYNESKVDQGRKNNDLYERLKEDIDRSRQMYDERISEDVRKNSNYFYDELVRILADGKAETLGL